MKFELLPEIKYFHKLWSIRFLVLAGFIALLQTLYGDLPLSLQMHLPVWLPTVLDGLTWASGAAAGIARFIKQTKLELKE